MDKRVSLVLVSLIIIALLLILTVFLIPDSSSEGVGKENVQNIELSSVVVNEDLDRRVGNCLDVPGQVRSGGNCDYPVNEERKCYRIERRGCNEVKVEVSCFEGVNQVRGEGYCFNLPLERKRCYNSRIKGCNEVLTETSCFEGVNQVIGEGNCDYPNQVLRNCDSRPSRVICDSY